MALLEPRAAAMRRNGLLILTLINLVNYLDRFVLSALVESLKHSELALSDTQLGTLMPGFIVVYMVASPFFGTLGDRRSRTRLIALGVGLWSVATVLAGFARSFATLFAARALVGVGEAAYGTISPSLLADYYPRLQRGRVFAFFYAAIPIGSALGYVLGGLVDRHFGWRSAFYVAGVPGILLAFLCLKLTDPPRGAQDLEDAPRAKADRGVVQTYLDLLKNGAYLLTVLGYAAYTFAIGGLAFWMPAFLERMRGVPREDATVQFGAIVVVTGFVGTFAGGWLGDYFLKYSKQAYLYVSGIATLLAFPLGWLALSARSPEIYFTAVVLAEILMFASTGPINSAIVNLVAPTERATAVALHIFVIHVLGDVPSPLLIGAVSDRTGSLGFAMILFVPASILVAGIVWMLAARQASRQGVHA
jgi:MFS transporter, Spinster family, sphingosine-1-phosphate transporter